MVPPFYDIFKTEVKIRDLKDLNMLIINEDSGSYFCVPKQYKFIDRYESKLEEYEEELIQLTMKPFTPCGHAFIVLDSIYAVEACSQRFMNKPKSYYRHL
jgi:hypothetical protein